MSSQELTTIRRTLSKVSSDLKQGNLLSAAKAVRAGARVFGRIPMIKNEQEELIRLLTDAAMYLQNSAEVRRIFPLAVIYTPGDEQSLAADIEELIAALEEEAAAAMNAGLQSLQDRQRTGLEKGRSELNADKHEDARATFKNLADEFPGDGELFSEIGESFMQHGMYEDACGYLDNAALMLESAHALNRLGIALRKLKRFDLAEEKYRTALSLEPNDPNLHFNLGRLYLDWKKWKECMLCAEATLRLQPEFTEAAQMAAYCARMSAQKPA